MKPIRKRGMPREYQPHRPCPPPKASEPTPAVAPIRWRVHNRVDGMPITYAYDGVLGAGSRVIVWWARSESPDGHLLNTPGWHVVLQFGLGRALEEHMSVPITLDHGEDACRAAIARVRQWVADIQRHAEALP